MSTQRADEVGSSILRADACGILKDLLERLTGKNGEESLNRIKLFLKLREWDWAILAMWVKIPPEQREALVDSGIFPDVLNSNCDAIDRVLLQKALGFKSSVVDLDADPFVPEGWTVVSHKKGGKFEFDPNKVKLHLSENQQNGKVIEGSKLRKELEVLKIFNANLLDFYIGKPFLIPEEWKGKAVFFWGTIYRNSDGRLCVRYLFWDGDGWRWSSSWLGYDFHDDSPAALSQD
jgi:hypothetical protein